MPEGQASRAFQFGILGMQLLGGTVTEAVKQNMGLSEETAD